MSQRIAWFYSKSYLQETIDSFDEEETNEGIKSKYFIIIIDFPIKFKANGQIWNSVREIMLEYNFLWYLKVYLKVLVENQEKKSS